MIQAFQKAASKRRKGSGFATPDRAQTSEIRFHLGPCEIAIQVTGRISKRQRRTLALGLFRQLKPMMQLIRDEYIQHRDSSGIARKIDESRGISLSQALDPTNGRPRIGYRLRMARLARGLSQEETARECRMSRSHLSSIERDQIRPREKTLARLRSVLVDPFPNYPAMVRGRTVVKRRN